MGRIGLGTVQFGMDYGVSNRGGKTSAEEAARILNEAAGMGVRTLDTAAGYGDSESVLGRVIGAEHNFDIVTKTVQINRARISPKDAEAIERAFTQSLVHLNAESIYGLMIHGVDDLLNDSGRFIWRAMCEFRRSGRAKKIGASVYSAEQIDRLLQDYDIDIIQVPLNIFDQRLIQSGHLQKLRQNGVEIHVRSVFLQGLLLMKPETLPHGLSAAREMLAELHEELGSAKVTPLEAALDFVLSIPEVDRAVIGICTVDQLREIYCAMGAGSHGSQIDWSRFAIDDEKILNPANWPKEKS